MSKLTVNRNEESIGTRLGFLVLFGVLALLFCSCGKETRLPVSPIVSELMEKIGVSHCYINKLGDYHTYKQELHVPVFTDDEVTAAFQKEISVYGELTDEVVKAELDFESLSDYEEYFRRQYVEQAKIDLIFAARCAVEEYLLSIAEFQLDEKEVAEYSRHLVYREENLSTIYGYNSFEEYLREELKLTEDQFLQKCITDGEKEIKKYLVIGAVANLENITIDSQEDVEAKYQELENAVYESFFIVDEGF